MRIKRNLVDEALAEVAKRCRAIRELYPPRASGYTAADQCVREIENYRLELSEARIAHESR